MPLKSRFLSLRQQGLVAVVLIVLAAAGSIWLEQTAMAQDVESAQEDNADRWIQQLRQTLIAERQQAMTQRLPTDPSDTTDDFVFLHWYPESASAPLSFHAPVADTVLQDLWVRAQTEPANQIECAQQCLLIQSVAHIRLGAPGRLIAISRLDPLLQRLQQASGITGFFLGALPATTSAETPWQTLSYQAYSELLSSATSSLLPKAVQRIMSQQLPPTLTVGQWSKLLADALLAHQIWMTPLTDASSQGPLYLLLMAKAPVPNTVTRLWHWFPLWVAIMAALGWSGWQWTRIQRLQQLLALSTGDTSSEPLAPTRYPAHDELSMMTRQVRALQQQLDDNTATLAQQATLLQQHSLYDPLTGLPNRDCFMFEVGRQLAALQRYPTQLALILLEINGFKQLSHSVGHQEGERLLQRVAQELSLSVREADLLCHLSGDLFALLISNLQDETQVHIIIAKLQSRLESSLLLTDRNFALQFSAGVVMIDSSEIPANELLRQAEMALNEVKLQADQRYQVFTPQLQEKSVRNHFIEQRLSQALRSGEIYLQYQPIQDCKQQKIIGLEALSRWQLPLEGNIPPLEFIPILENSRLGLQFGNWVLEQALHQLHQLDVAGMTGLQMAINLTGQQLLDPELKNTLERLTLTYHIIPSRISLELNEQALRVNYQQAQQVMTALQQAGYRLTLDDFGTGYSALTYLSRLPFHTIKLDRSFTLRMLDCEMDKQLVGNIIQMAHSLGKRVVGEGVDNSLQSLWLQELGCDQLQGHILAAPIGECDLLSKLAPFYQYPRVNTLDSAR